MKRVAKKYKKDHSDPLDPDGEIWLMCTERWPEIGGKQHIECAGEITRKGSHYLGAKCTCPCHEIKQEAPPE